MTDLAVMARALVKRDGQNTAVTCVSPPGVRALVSDPELLAIHARGRVCRT